MANLVTQCRGHTAVMNVGDAEEVEWSVCMVSQSDDVNLSYCSLTEAFYSVLPLHCRWSVTGAETKGDAALGSKKWHDKAGPREPETSADWLFGLKYTKLPVNFYEPRAHVTAMVSDEVNSFRCLCVFSALCLAPVLFERRGTFSPAVKIKISFFFFFKWIVFYFNYFILNKQKLV